jgi:hypothetical protein
MNLNQKKSDFEFDFENAKLFSISLNTSINRNRTSSNKCVKRARLERIEKKNESKQINNDNKKFAFHERLTENDDDDSTNDVKKKNENDDNLDKNVSRDNVNKNSSRQKSSAKILKKRKRV